MKIKTALIISFIYCFLAAQSFASGFMPVANIIKIQGNVFLNKEKAKAGDEIAVGMLLSMPKSGDYADIKFQNGHILRFVAASVKIEELTPKTATILLTKGKAFAAVRPMTLDEIFIIKTKKVSVNASGTKLILEESKTQTYIGVVEGSIKIQAKGQAIDVKKSEELSVSKAPALTIKTASRSKMDTAKAILQTLETP